MVSASTNDEAIGKSFLISGPDTVTWEQFYSHYEGILGTKSTISISTVELRTMIESAKRRNGRSFAGTLSRLAAPLRAPAKRVPGSVRAVRKLKSVMPPAERRTTIAPASFQPAAAHTRSGKNTGKVFLPDEARLKLCRSNATVSTMRARNILGWKPEYDFGQGMKLTGKFIRWANLV
jgi:hypothetical protein